MRCDVDACSLSGSLRSVCILHPALFTVCICAVPFKSIHTRLIRRSECEISLRLYAVLCAHQILTSYHVCQCATTSYKLCSHPHPEVQNVSVMLSK